MSVVCGRSSTGRPDWTCIVVGFTSGYVRFYTEVSRFAAVRRAVARSTSSQGLAFPTWKHGHDAGARGDLDRGLLAGESEKKSQL